LVARALTEGIERYDAIEMIETGERLGVSIHADAGWDALSISIEVPAARLEPALELVAEVLPHRPSRRTSSSGCATNDSTTSSQRRPIRADEPSTPLPRRSTRKRRPITGDRAGFARRSSGSRPITCAGHTRVRSIRGEPRGRIEAVDVEAEAASARAHLDVDNAVVVLVGEVHAFDGALEAASFAPVEIERDPSPEPPLTAEQGEAPGPFDKDDEEGPTAGAEEPELPGVPTEPAEAD
jgi:hypothetical protein